MIPAPFDYHRPSTLDEAIRLLAGQSDAKVLAGGHSLIPAMKLRLAQPPAVVDLSRVPGLKNIRADGARIRIGALCTHREIESSELLSAKCPLLPEVAATIGDAQVRNRGTIGGSIAHADPAADWPAAILALNAEMEIAGPSGRRVVPASGFFLDMMQSAVQPGEILVEIRVPATAGSVAYVKSPQKASGFALTGVAVVIDCDRQTVALGVTGAAAKAYRATTTEALLRGRDLDLDLLAGASAKADNGVEMLNDIHASSEYRAHLTRVNARRALDLAFSRT